jgi:hypothetical protein
MIKKTTYFMLCSVFLLFTACKTEKGPVVYEDLDTDANGYITKDEAKVRKDLLKNWDKADTDGDGQLTVTEYINYEGKGRLEAPEDLETPELGAAPR